MHTAPGQRYRLNTETIAVTIGDRNRSVAIKVLPGSIITILDGSLKPGGFIPVEWDGKACEMFVRDLEERGEMVATARLGF